MLLRLPDPQSRAAASVQPEGAASSTEAGESRGPDSIGAERALQVQFVGAFEGWSLVTIACDHQPMWLASELARMLGFTDERPGIAVATLLGVLIQRWREQAPSQAFVYIDGGDRRELLEKLDRAQVVLGPEERRKPLALLSMSAVDELVASLDSAVGRRLRTHLREHVVPEFYAWERAARALEQPLLSPDAATIAGNRLEFERRCFEAAVLERLLDRLERAGFIDADQLIAHRVVSSDIALGGRLEDHSEQLAHGWSTPTQIARRWCEMSPIRVGRLIAHLGLKGSRAHSRALINKARGHERTVVTYVYSPSAVALIERELRSRGFRRCTCGDIHDSDVQE